MARSWEAPAPASKIQVPTDEHGEDEPMFAMFTHLHDPMTGAASGTVAETGTRTKVRARCWDVVGLGYGLSDVLAAVSAQPQCVGTAIVTDL
jgi:hypothetical protein